MGSEITNNMARVIIENEDGPFACLWVAIFKTHVRDMFNVVVKDGGAILAGMWKKYVKTTIDEMDAIIKGADGQSK